MLNPIVNPKPIAREVNQYIFLALADFNLTTLQLEPILIKSIPNAEKVTDGPYAGQTVYTFEIRDEAKWDNGSPITAEDYLSTLKSVMHPMTNAATFRSYLKNVSDVKVDPSNPKKGMIYFEKYYMLEKELSLNIEVYPKHIYDTHGYLDKYSFKDLKNEEKFQNLAKQDSTLIQFANDYNGSKYGREIVDGSGPYELESWTTGQQIVLTKKKNYWAENLSSTFFANNADKIIFEIIPDENAALTALKSGELDMVSGISSPAFNDMSNDSTFKKEFQFLLPRLMKFYYLILNNNDPKLASVNTRTAISHLTDVDRYIANLENGYGERMAGPFNPARRYTNKSLTPISYDIEKAKILLAEDGWKDSNHNGTLDKTINGKLTEFKLEAYASGDLGKNICLLLQESCKKVGIDLEVLQKDFSIISKENLAKGKFGIIPSVASQDVVDDDPELRFMSSNADIGGSNYSGYKNARIDSLITLLHNTSDLTKRDDYYREFQDIIYHDQPYIFLYVPNEKIIVNNRWKASATSKRPGYAANTFTFVPQFAKMNAN